VEKKHGSELEGYEDIPDKIDLKELLMRDYRESKVGKMLSEFTTRKVILLVLAMLFSTPAMAVDSYLTEPDSYAYGLSLIKGFGPSTVSGH
jgi:hypothetical protein